MTASFGRPRAWAAKPRIPEEIEEDRDVRVDPHALPADLARGVTEATGPQASTSLAVHLFERAPHVFGSREPLLADVLRQHLVDEGLVADAPAPRFLVRRAFAPACGAAR